VLLVQTAFMWQLTLALRGMPAQQILWISNALKTFMRSWPKRQESSHVRNTGCFAGTLLAALATLLPD
jgi:hypothetical protein